jgi:hypothetical protein
MNERAGVKLSEWMNLKIHSYFSKKSETVVPLLMVE